MLTGEQIVQIVEIAVSAIVAIITLYFGRQVQKLTTAAKDLRATIASYHALLLNPPK